MQKFAIVALALLGVVAADVSHLNNMYLPPVLEGLAPKEHVSYAQEAQEIPQAPVHEVTDNSVVDDAAVAHEEAQKASGHLVVESAHFGGAGFGGHSVAAVAQQHVQTAAGLAHHVHAHAQQVVSAVAADAPAAVEHEVEQQQYDVNADVAVPQEEAHFGYEQQHHVEEHHAEPVHHEEQHSFEHHVAADAPVAGEFGQQADFASVSSSASSSSSSGIDTQYGSNGGYVY